jgi:hypothetical protein
MYDIAQSHRILDRVVQHLSQKIMIQIQLLNMFMISCCAKFHFSKSSGSRVVSIKQNVNFNFQPPAMFIFLDFHRSGVIKSCLFLDDLSAHKIAWSHID